MATPMRASKEDRSSHSPRCSAKVEVPSIPLSHLTPPPSPPPEVEVPSIPLSHLTPPPSPPPEVEVPSIPLSHSKPPPSPPPEAESVQHEEYIEDILHKAAQRDVELHQCQQLCNDLLTTCRSYVSETECHLTVEEESQSMRRDHSETSESEAAQSECRRNTILDLGGELQQLVDALGESPATHANFEPGSSDTFVAAITLEIEAAKAERHRIVDVFRTELQEHEDSCKNGTMAQQEKEFDMKVAQIECRAAASELELEEQLKQSAERAKIHQHEMQEAALRTHGKAAAARQQKHEEELNNLQAKGRARERDLEEELNRVKLAATSREEELLVELEAAKARESKLHRELDALIDDMTVRAPPANSQVERQTSSTSQADSSTTSSRDAQEFEEPIKQETYEAKLETAIKHGSKQTLSTCADGDDSDTNMSLQSLQVQEFCHWRPTTPRVKTADFPREAAQNRDYSDSTVQESPRVDLMQMRTPRTRSRLYPARMLI